MSEQFFRLESDRKQAEPKTATKYYYLRSFEHPKKILNKILDTGIW